MTTWEYKVDRGVSLGGKITAEKLEEYLNNEGAKTWGLVAFLAGNPKEGREDLWVFKRQKLVGTGCC
jgi:hypothetical protein